MFPKNTNLKSLGSLHIFNVSSSGEIKIVVDSSMLQRTSLMTVLFLPVVDSNSSNLTSSRFLYSPSAFLQVVVGRESICHLSFVEGLRLRLGITKVKVKTHNSNIRPVGHRICYIIFLFWSIVHSLLIIGHWSSNRLFDSRLTDRLIDVVIVIFWNVNGVSASITH